MKPSSIEIVHRTQMILLTNIYINFSIIVLTTIHSQLIIHRPAHEPSVCNIFYFPHEIICQMYQAILRWVHGLRLIVSNEIYNVLQLCILDIILQSMA